MRVEAADEGSRHWLVRNGAGGAEEMKTKLAELQICLEPGLPLPVYREGTRQGKGDVTGLQVMSFIGPPPKRTISSQRALRLG